jgi:hypothetical protein
VISWGINTEIKGIINSAPQLIGLHDRFFS